MSEPKIVIPPHIQAAIAKTIEGQKAEDAIGLAAATTALPGALRDVWTPAPDISVGKYSVRRFVDRDFMHLSFFGHPLNRFTALADGSYKFEPSGELAWQLCWLLTRPNADVKSAFKIGVENAKNLADAEFGEFGIFALAEIMGAIAKQMEIYASAHLDMKPNNPEGKDDASPPSLSQPS